VPNEYGVCGWEADVGEDSIILESREPNLARKDFFSGSGAETNDRDQGSAVSFWGVKRRKDAHICCGGSPFAPSSLCDPD